jgi:soluble lytic murein transglycosylase-like protein
MASAAQYDCTDERGIRHRLPTKVDMALIRFDCVEVATAAQAKRPFPVNRYSSVMLTMPSIGAPPPAMAPQWPPGLRTQALPHAALATARALGTPLDPLIRAVAKQFNHDPDLLRAIVKVESGFNARAISPKGAMGLMQLMPATARRFGVEDKADLFTPGVNLEAGARYLAHLKQLFPGQLDLAIAAYNAGEGAVIQRNYRIPPFPETQSYVQQVLTWYRHFRNERAAPGHHG